MSWPATGGVKAAIALTDAMQARTRMALSQAQFVKLLGVSVRTLQEWDQGRKKPIGAAQTLLGVAVRTRKALLGRV